MKLYSQIGAITLAVIVIFVQPTKAGRWSQFLQLSEVTKMKYDPLTQTYWFGTENNGLWRYDGQQFEHISLPINNEVTVTALALAKNGDTLWVGAHQGILGYHIKSKTWTIYNLDYIQALFVDARGALWFSLKTSEIAGAIGKKDKTGWSRWTLPHQSQVLSIAQDREGKMYFGTRGAGLCILDSAFTWKCFDSFPLTLQPIVQAIAIDRTGKKWLGTSKGVFLLDPANRTVSRLPRPDLSSLKQTDRELRETIHAIWIDDGEMKWFATSAGVSVLDSTNRRWKTFTKENGPGSDQVSDIIGDSDGNLWFGLLELSGVSKLNNNWSELAATDGLESDFAYAVEKDRRGRLWIGTQAGGIQILERGVWRKPALVGDICLDSLSGVSRCSDTPFVTDFLPDQTGMWVTTATCGIFKLSDFLTITNRFRQNCPVDFPSDRVNAIAVRNDTLWAGTDRGLAQVLLASRKVNVYLENTYISALIHDDRGRLWVGTDKGLCLFNALQCDVSGLPGYVQNVAINALDRDQSGNLWVGTNFGLARFDGVTWTQFSRANGLPGEKISAIGVAPDGTVWCGTVDGAAAFINNQWHPFRTDEGLSSNFILDISFGPPNVVWFATWGGGVSQYRRTEIGPNTYFLETFDIVTETNMTFHYAGYDLNTPATSLRYQYALGDDSGSQLSPPDWSPITPAPFVELQISTEGVYNFFVRAVDKDGNFDETPARMRFYKVEPRHGGAVTIVDSTLGKKLKSLRLYVPPNTLPSGSSIRVQSAPVDTSELAPQQFGLRFTGIAFALVPQPANTTMISGRPLTLTIFYRDSIAQQFEAGMLAVYRRDPSNWTLIGGTVDAKRQALTTALTQPGTYALFVDFDASQKNSSSKTHIDNLTAQPRMFSPHGDDFAENVTISFGLDQPTAVTVKIYNLAGRLVQVICENEMMNAGRNAVHWEGDDYGRNKCPSGMYLICLEAAGKTATKTVMVSNQ